MRPRDAVERCRVALGSIRQMEGHAARRLFHESLALFYSGECVKRASVDALHCIESIYCMYIADNAYCARASCGIGLHKLVRARDGAQIERQ